MLCELYLMVQFSGTKHIHTVVQISLSSVSQIFHFLNYILFSQLLPLWTIHLQYIQVVSLCLGLSIGTVHAQSCLTLCDPMDCSPPGSSVHGIIPARILEWVAISYSRRSSQPRLNPCLLHLPHYRQITDSTLHRFYITQIQPMSLCSSPLTAELCPMRWIYQRLFSHCIQ